MAFTTTLPHFTQSSSVGVVGYLDFVQASQLADLFSHVEDAPNQVDAAVNGFRSSRIGPGTSMPTPATSSLRNVQFLQLVVQRSSDIRQDLGPLPSFLVGISHFWDNSPLVSNKPIFTSGTTDVNTKCIFLSSSCSFLQCSSFCQSYYKRKIQLCESASADFFEKIIRLVTFFPNIKKLPRARRHLILFV